MRVIFYVIPSLFTSSLTSYRASPASNSNYCARRYMNESFLLIIPAWSCPYSNWKRLPMSLVWFSLTSSSIKWKLHLVRYREVFTCQFQMAGSTCLKLAVSATTKLLCLPIRTRSFSLEVSCNCQKSPVQLKQMVSTRLRGLLINKALSLRHSWQTHLASRFMEISLHLTEGLPC